MMLRGARRRPRHGQPLGLASVCTVIAVTLAGCSSPRNLGGDYNAPPTVRVTSVSRIRIEPMRYSATVRWTGHDPDGRVTRFEYAIDPPAGGAVEWIATERAEMTAVFDNDDPRRVHRLVLRALDNEGAYSAPVEGGLAADVLPPPVQIVQPRPSAVDRAFVPNGLDVHFAVPDHEVFSGSSPTSFRWILLGNTTGVTLATALQYPDSIRAYYAARDWQGWNVLPASARSLSIPDLPVNAERMLAIVALDTIGGYSPVMSRTTNLLYLHVIAAAATQPTLTIFSGFFAFDFPPAYTEPGHPPFQLEVLADRRLALNWFGTAAPGAIITHYRWWTNAGDSGVVDVPLVDPQTPGPALSASVTSPVLATNQVWRLEIEIEQNYVHRTRFICEFVSVGGAPDRDLLIVDDTRLLVDERLPGQPNVRPPRGRWPTAAELDTFLYARGGYPWREYPAGTITTPGLFAGYAFDTLGTRKGVLDVSVRLETLARYRHIIWMTEQNSALNSVEDNVLIPMGALRYMSRPGRVNPLGAYIAQGGRVWLLGGGAGTAMTIDYDRPQNNGLPYGQTFSYALGELVPGRFMYDFVRWRSSFRDILAVAQMRKTLGRQASDPFYANASLPATFLQKTSSTDPVPPNRTTSLPSDYFPNVFYIEYVGAPNEIVEDRDPGPGENFQAAMDTLYGAVGGVFPPVGAPPLSAGNACMTIYPARDITPTPSVIFSGFDIWSWRRTQCQQLVDFVLRDLWGLAPAMPGVPAAGAAVATPRTPAVAPARESADVPRARRAPRAGRAPGA